MDELQLGDDLVREGYRLSCQCAVTGADHRAGGAAARRAELPDPGRGSRPGRRARRACRSRPASSSSTVAVTLPKEEHHQTSDLEELLAAIGRRGRRRGARRPQAGCPQALREYAGAGHRDHLRRPGHRGRARATPRCSSSASPSTSARPAWSRTLMELESGEQLASVSSLNPQAVFGGDLMSRIAFAQFDAGEPPQAPDADRRPPEPARRAAHRASPASSPSGSTRSSSSATRACTTSCSASTRPTSASRPTRPVVRDAAGRSPRASSSCGCTPRRACASCRSWPASSAPTRWRWRSPRASATRRRVRHRRGHRHQRRGAARLARAAVGVLGARRPRARGRADPPRHARRAGRDRPRVGRGRRPPPPHDRRGGAPRASAARASSTPSPRSSTPA